MKKLIIGLCVALCGLALTANATAYTEADFTASADNTLTLTEDSTLTVGSDISIGKLTVEGSGYTLTLAGSFAITAMSLEIGSGVTVQLASGTTLANGALQSSTVTGAGVIGYTAVAPDALESWADEDNWTGTVWVQGLSQNAWNPTGLGNANSTRRLSGFTGYFAQAYITVPFAIELENSIYSSAIHLTDGYSYNQDGKAYFATPTLKGAGTFRTTKKGGSLFIVTTDWSGFTGTFTLNDKTVWLGYATPGTTPAYAATDEDVYWGTVSGGIRIAADKEVTITPSAGWTFPSTGGFIGEGTVKLLYPWQATNYLGTNEKWTGTVELAAHEATSATQVNLDYMGNANSKIVLKGLTSNGGNHYLRGSSGTSSYPTSYSIPATVQLDGEVTIDNGWSYCTHTFANITGKGDIATSKSGLSSAYLVISCASNYYGRVGGSGIGVTVKKVARDIAPSVDDCVLKIDSTKTSVTYSTLNYDGAWQYALEVGGVQTPVAMSLSTSETYGYGYHVTATSGRTVYWIGGESGNFSTASNWALADGTVLTARPSDYTMGAGDTVVFTNEVALTVDCHAVVTKVVLDANVTLTSDAYTGDGSSAKYLFCDGITGEGMLTLAGATIAPIQSSRPYYIHTDIVVAESTKTNTLFCSNFINYFYGDLSGDGYLEVRTKYNSAAGGLAFYGDNSAFDGEIKLYDTAVSNRHQSKLYYGNASSSNAVWEVHGFHNNINTHSIFPDGNATGETYYFGALKSGSVLQPAYSRPIIEVGARDDVASSVALAGRYDNNNYITINKIGTNILECTIANSSYPRAIGPVNIYGGILKLTRMADGTISFLGDGATLEVFDEEIYASYKDPSALIKNSTSAICFDDEGVDRTWATALASSNTGGLTKKGAGTLTLSEVPLYSGPTRVEEGTLIVPFGTQFESLYVADGASVQVDLADASETGVILFSSGSKTGSGSVSYINTPDSYNVETINTISAIIYANGTRTLTWCGPTADETDPENVTYDYAWETASNWSPANTPTTIDNLVFNTATPGCVMSAASTVLSITADSGLTLTNAYALTVLGDMTVTGAFVKEGAATLIVGGAFSATEGTTVKNGAIKANLATAQSVVFDTDAYTNGAGMSGQAYGAGNGKGTNTLTGPNASGNGYGAKFVTPNAELLTVTGSGVIEADGALAVTSGSFAGSLAGGMGLAKSSDGTFSLFGNQTFEGDVAILGGTLKLATPLDLDGLRADFDASDADAFEYDETDGETIVKWNPTAAMSGFTLNLTNGYESTHYTDAVAPVRTVDEDGYAYVSSEKFLMSENYSNSKNDNYIARSFFFVAKTSSGNFVGNWEFGAASTPCRWGIKTRNYNLLRKGPNSTDWYVGGLWENGALAAQDSGTGGVPYPSSSRALISAVKGTGIVRGSGYDNRMYIGGKAEAEWSEVLTYTREMGFDEKAAVEQYLMAKWGIGDATYNALPATANVTLASGATLDLGGQTVTVASFTGAGKVQNGTLKTADNTVTVTGDLTIPAADNTTYVIPADADEIRLRLTGTAENVTVDASAITKPLHIYYEGDMTLSVPKRWENYTHANNWYHIGSYPFSIFLR